MTAKEKAKQLFNKFMKPVDAWHKYPMCFDTAKQCALIAVEEIIEQNNIWIKQIRKGTNNYWQQVKIEIDNL